MNHFEVAKEEIAFYGPEQASLQNILAVLIGPKADPAVTGTLASLGINRLLELGVDELKKFEGIGEVTARRIVTSIGLAAQIGKFKSGTRPSIKSPEDAYKIVEDLATLNHEQFEVLFLNTKNQVLARKMIFKGSLNVSIVHPREVFKEALKFSSASIICVHNHPSGNSRPSTEDINITKRLKQAGDIIGIEVLDHLVVGQGEYTSLKEQGHM